MRFRYMFSKKSKRKKLFVCIVLIICTAVIYLYQASKQWQCSEQDSRDIIYTICNLYKNGYIVGSLCPYLCGPNKKVKYEGCTNYRTGKTVLFTTCTDVCVPKMTVSAVLKSHFPNIHKFTKTYLDGDQSVLSPISTLQKMVIDSIMSNLGINMTLRGDIMNIVFEEDYSKYIQPENEKSYQALAITVWSLVQQDEYILTKINQYNELFPRIYHSCGSMYLVESSPPGPILDSGVHPFNLGVALWKDRAEIALKLLRAISAMESEFDQPLHMCDLKGENFGLGGDGGIKLIDTDSIHFHDKLMKEFANTESCSINRDCDYWDCHGICDKDGKCMKERLNNNLQSLCEDVFNAYLPIFNNGLLEYPPNSIRKDLKETLEECIRPQSQDQKATETTHNRLYNLLQTSIENTEF